MKTKILYLAMVTLLTVIAITSCTNKKNSRSDETMATTTDTHNSRNSLDYEGTYTGTFPCADCSGIYTEITLSGDNYKMTQVYQGVEEGDNSFEESGTYTWNNNGSIITLGGDKTEQYQVGENMLLALDENGKRIAGDLADLYILRKR